MKRWKRISAVLLSVLLLLTLLPGTMLAEDEIVPEEDELEIAVETPEAEGEPELILEDEAAPEEIMPGLPEDALTLDGALTTEEIAPAENAIATNDGESIPVDEAHFPDASLRKAIANMYDLSRDGTLSPEECSMVRFIGLAGLGLTELNLKGIEYFPELRTLDCSNNQLTSLDVSNLAALPDLNISSNQLTSLDVSNMTALSSLDVSNNQLTSLTISGCTALKNLRCENNPAMDVVARGCTSLESLSYTDFPMTSLDVSGCTSLSYLNCSNNQLTRLVANGCTALSSVYCNNNPITYLDLSGCTSMWTVIFNNTPLETMNLSGCSSLEEELYCSGTNNNPGTLKDLDVSGCSSLIEINCSKNQLTRLKLDGCTQLERLYCQTNQLETLDLEGCKALDTLYCGNNKLRTLDLRPCTRLELLNCVKNSLSSLDLSNCKQLHSFYCQYNNIKVLDLSNNTYVARIVKNGTDSSKVAGVVRIYDEDEDSEDVVYFDSTTKVTANGKTLYAPSGKAPTAPTKAPTRLPTKKPTKVPTKAPTKAPTKTPTKAPTKAPARTVRPTATPQPSKKTSLQKCSISSLGAKTYTGKAITPAPVVKYNGKALKKGTDYTVSYSDNTNIGTAKVTLKGKGKYTGSVTKSFKINPSKVRLTSLTAGSKQLKAAWKKGAGGVSYELQYSLKKDFSTKKTVTISKNATVSKVIKGLTSGKTYYVRIRAFKTVSGTKYVSAWSGVLSKKVN